MVEELKLTSDQVRIDDVVRGRWQHLWRHNLAQHHVVHRVMVIYIIFCDMNWYTVIVYIHRKRNSKRRSTCSTRTVRAQPRSFYPSLLVALSHSHSSTVSVEDALCHGCVYEEAIRRCALVNTSGLGVRPETQGLDWGSLASTLWLAQQRRVDGDWRVTCVSWCLSEVCVVWWWCRWCTWLVLVA